MRSVGGKINHPHEGGTNVRKGLVISTFLVLAALSFGAQGHGRGRGAATPDGRHSNAPSGTTAASSDRDKGRDRAEDVGKGKKKGLKKQASKHKRGRS
jgi:hypothetical protein